MEKRILREQELNGGATQKRLGEKLRTVIDDISREPLPEEMVLLLEQLRHAESNSPRCRR